jgi:hypothetical protein
MADPKSDAEIMYLNQQTTKDWKIELKYLPIAHRGHAFLALVDHDGKVVGELHGLAKSKHTGEIVAMGMDGSDFVAKGNENSRFGGKPISVVGSGSKEETEKLWKRGMRTAEAINSQKFDYKAHDPSYELGTDGGQIRNSNSVAFTLGKAMRLGLSRALQENGMTRTFSGWDRDLLDPKYRRYVAPPVFPVKDAP